MRSPLSLGSALLTLAIVLSSCAPAPQGGPDAPHTGHALAASAPTGPLQVELDHWVAGLPIDAPPALAGWQGLLPAWEVLRPLADHGCDVAPTAAVLVRDELQLDSDPELESVVRVALTSPGPGGRCEHHWLGFFDPDPDGGSHRLAGVVEERALHCAVDGSASAVALTALPHGPGVQLRVQEVATCGPRVDFRYREARMRLHEGALHRTVTRTTPGLASAGS